MDLGSHRRKESRCSTEDRHCQGSAVHSAGLAPGKTSENRAEPSSIETATMSGSSHYDGHPSDELSMKSSRGSRGRGSRRGRGGRGEKQNVPSKNSREVMISKAMSFILRHGAQKEGLRLDERGYARVDELVHRLLFLVPNTYLPYHLTLSSLRSFSAVDITTSPFFVFSLYDDRADRWWEG